MKHAVLFTAVICVLVSWLGGRAQEQEKQSSQSPSIQGTHQPGPGQVLVTSRPGGLKVYIEKHKELPKTPLVRDGGIEGASVGSTPLTLDLEPGYYTVAVERSFNPGDANSPRAPRGNTLFFGCYKCSYYAGDKQFRDPIDPYRRDGNIGVCFYASEAANEATRYYRLYAIQKGGEAVSVDAKFDKITTGRK